VLFFTVEHSLAYIGAIAMHATNQNEWLRRETTHASSDYACMHATKKRLANLGQTKLVIQWLVYVPLGIRSIFQQTPP
jgi:hypothetical protein